MQFRGRDVYRATLYTGILSILLMFLIWPIVLTVRGGFVGGDGGFTLGFFFDPETGVLRDPLYLRGLLNAFLIAVCTTLLCLVVTLPMAAIATKRDFPGKSVVSALVLIPLILPPFVGAIGLRAILGRTGSLNALLQWIGVLGPDHPGIDFLAAQFYIPGIGEFNGVFFAVVLMEALHLYPILYLNITASMANLDPSLDEAALNLGAGKWRRFFKCTLPLILPGIFAGSTIVFIWSFTELGTPLMFEYTEVTPVQVFYGLTEISTSQRPYALVVVMLVSALILYLMGKFAFGGRAYEMQSKAQHAQALKKLTGFRAFAAASLFIGVTLLAVMPHLGVILNSVSGMTAGNDWYRTVLPQSLTTEHYEGMLKHSLAVPSIINSLIYALAAMVLAIILGLAIAYLAVRVKVKGGWLLDTLGMLPLAVPGLVMAFGYVAMSLTWPFRPVAPGSHSTVISAAAMLFGVTALFFLVYTLSHTVVRLKKKDAFLPAITRFKLAFIGFCVLVIGVCTWLWFSPPMWVQDPVASVLATAPLSMFQLRGELPDPLVFLIVAYTIRRLPYILRSASAGLEQTSGQLEEAALNLGASLMTAIRRIVVPLIMANLIAGGILVFAFAMLEVSDSLILAEREQHYPVTKAIWTLYNRLGDGQYIASAMGVWGMALLAVTLIGASVLMGKKLGAIFRV
ncbi:MAG: iron ABC transporter permease [Planctomycetota bacterium]